MEDQQEDQVVPQTQNPPAQAQLAQALPAPRSGKGRKVMPSTSQGPEVRVTYHEIPRTQDQGQVQATQSLPQPLQGPQVNSTMEERPWIAGRVRKLVYKFDFLALFIIFTL